MPHVSIAAIGIVASFTLALAQITKPPEFQSSTKVQTGAAAATVDGTSHVAVEQARIDEELVSRLRKLPGHGEGIRLIEAKLLPVATEHFLKNNQPIGAAVTKYLSGMAEASGKDLVSISRRSPKDLALLPFLGETIGTVPELAEAMLGAVRGIAQAHPESAEAQYYLARSLSKQSTQPRDEMARLLRRAADLDPKDTRALLELARQYTEQEKQREAISTLLELLQRDPNAATAHYRLAGLYRAAGQMEKSREHMRDFQRLQPLKQ